MEKQNPNHASDLMNKLGDFAAAAGMGKGILKDLEKVQHGLAIVDKRTINGHDITIDKSGNIIISKASMDLFNKVLSIID